jgi:hypothetical protein
MSQMTTAAFVKFLWFSVLCGTQCDANYVDFVKAKGDWFTSGA